MKKILVAMLLLMPGITPVGNAKTKPGDSRPAPFMRLGTVNGTTAYVDEVLALPALVLDFKDCPAEKGKWHIVAYNIELFRGGGERQITIPIRHKGDTYNYLEGVAFNEQATTCIKGMKKGDRIFIDDVKAATSDGTIRTFNSVALTIK